MISGKKILIGITASISAYKTISLVRLLIKQGAMLRIVMTPAAKDFVSTTILSTFSNHKVYVDFVENDQWVNHVDLGRWADIFVVVPASCNTMAKMANGICDNFLLATYLSATCKTIIVPAMDEEMWLHPSTRANVKTLQSFGHEVIEPKEGFLASGLVGKGRMPEPEDLMVHIIENYCRSSVLATKKILITAGPTAEPIDPVRVLTNRSSGKMGYTIAETLYMLGADVTVVSGPVSIQTKYKGIKIIPVETAQEMYTACLNEQDNFDIGIFSAAVADYTISNPDAQKIKKQDASLSIQLTKTVDILSAFGHQKKEGQKLIGFALETNDGERNALAKINAKKADLIILNTLGIDNPCFGEDSIKVSFVASEDNMTHFDMMSKQELAETLAAYILKNWIK